MKTMLLALLVAAVGLAACETVQTAGPSKGRFVGMAPIPDEPEARSAKPRVQPVAASAAAVTPAAPRAPAAAPAGITTADAATAETPPVVPAPSDILPSEVVPSEPGRIEATPVTTGDEKPAASGFEISAIPAIMQALIGGIPLWLVALIGLALLGALVVGMRGARRSRDPYASAEPETA